MLPAICFIFHKLNKLYQLIPVVGGSFWLLYIYISAHGKQLDYYDFTEWILYFMLGSTVAIFYKKFEEHGLKKYISSYRLIEYSFCLINYAMLINGIRSSTNWPYDHFSEYITLTRFKGIYWALHIFLCLIAFPNHFTTFLSETKLLRDFGKYSFGTYLINIYIVHLNKKKLLGSTFNGLLLMLFLNYWFGFLFYYIVERNMMQLANWIITKMNNMCQKIQHVRLNNVTI
jgi:hypothetical protein